MLQFPDGKHDAMPFTTFEAIVRESAVKDVSFHYSKQGAQQGLPADVATMMFGEPKDGLQWNVRKGEMPEQDVFEDYELPMTNFEKLQEAGIVVRQIDAQRPQRSRKRRKLIHLGWRGVLGALVHKGLLDETRSQALQEWLGPTQITMIGGTVKTSSEFAVERAVKEM